METMLVAVVTGIASGAMSWGMVRMELRWLRADVEASKKDIADLQRALYRH